MEIGYLYALGAFACIGSYLVPSRLATAKGLAFFPFMGLGMVAADTLLWPFLKNLWSNPLWFWGSVLSGLLWACGQGLGNLALEEVSLAKAAVFFNVNSFINIGVGLVVFHEASGIQTYVILLAGGGLLFVGAWWVTHVTATPSKEGNLKKGILLSLAAGFFWGIYFVPVRALEAWHPQAGLSALDSLSGLLLGGSIPALLTGLFQRTCWTLRNIGLGAATAGLWTVGTAGFLLAIQSLGLSRAVPIINSNTLVYAGWSLFVFKEFPFSQWPKVLAGTVVVVAGVILMAFSK